MRVRVYLGSDREEDMADAVETVTIRELREANIRFTAKRAREFWSDEADCGEVYWRDWLRTRNVVSRKKRVGVYHNGY